MGQVFLYGSGGAGLNFKVIAVSSEITLPATAKENTIAIITDTTIKNVSFAVNEPTSPLAGDIWIITGRNSISFNALRKGALMVYPLSVQQYVGNEWVTKTAKIYQGGAWKYWITYYYTPGDTHADITGGWTATVDTWTQGADGISIASASNAVIMTTHTVDITNMSTLKASVDLSNVEGNPYVKFGLYASGDIYTFAASVEFPQSNAYNAAVTLDVSSVTGEYKLKFYGTRASAIKILQVEGTP